MYPAPLQDVGQCVQRRAHFQRREHFTGHTALVLADIDGSGRVDPLAEEAADHVGEHHPRGHQHGRVFDRGPHPLGAGRSCVDPQEGG